LNPGHLIFFSLNEKSRRKEKIKGKKGNYILTENTSRTSTSKADDKLKGGA